MTTAELLRLLKKNGCTLVRNGGNHDIDIYFSPITGNQFPVGRHAKEEIPNGTLQNILKRAGLKK